MAIGITRHGRDILWDWEIGTTESDAVKRAVREWIGRELLAHPEATEADAFTLHDPAFSVMASLAWATATDVLVTFYVVAMAGMFSSISE